MDEQNGKNYPLWTGTVRMKDEATDKYEQVGTVGIWENPKKEKANQPSYTGKIEMGRYEGKEFKKDGRVRFIALWNFKPRKNEGEDFDL